jgi:hypothetical protein
MITNAIIELLEQGLVACTVEELAKAVSNMLGVKVTPNRVKAALNRNSRRITFECGQFELSIEF